MNSFANSSFSVQNGGHSWVSNVVIVLLGIQLLCLTGLAVVFDPAGSSSNLFYLGSIGFLMAWTIYFAWHSLVKENSFELTAFMSMAIIMTTEGIYFLLTHSVPIPILYAGICYFVITFLLYLICCYQCYMHYSKTALSELEQSIHFNALHRIKDYNIFISIVKMNFVFYSVVTFTFLYYVMVDWTDFEVFGGVIFAVAYCAFIAHSAVGIWAASQEKRNYLIGFMAVAPLLQVVQGWMIYEFNASPAESIEKHLFTQALFLCGISLIITLGIIYLGIKNLQSFGTGVTSIIRQTNDDFFKAAFLR